MQKAIQSCAQAEMVNSAWWPQCDKSISELQLDPNEIRTTLDKLRLLISQVNSAIIKRDLVAAYNRIANISLTEI